MQVGLCITPNFGITNKNKRSVNFKKIISIFAVTIVFAGCDSGPQVKWQKFESAAWHEAQVSGKPTLVYFYAAWCRPCQKLRSTTFLDPQVIRALEGWNRLKADMSFREKKETIALGREFEIWGLPTLIFYDPAGNMVVKESGFLSASEVLDAIEKAEDLDFKMWEAPPQRYE